MTRRNRSAAMLAGALVMLAMMVASWIFLENFRFYGLLVTGIIAASLLADYVDSRKEIRLCDGEPPTHKEQMIQANIVKHIDVYFKDLVEKFGFVKQNEIYEYQAFVVFRAKTFALKVVPYRRELYAWLCKVDHPDDKIFLYTDDDIDLYNLLEYLNQDSSNVPESNYFVDEDDIEECYRKQIKYIASTIFDYFPQMDEFFKREEYDSELKNIDRFLREKYPEFFGKIWPDIE